VAIERLALVVMAALVPHHQLPEHQSLAVAVALALETLQMERQLVVVARPQLPELQILVVAAAVLLEPAPVALVDPALWSFVTLDRNAVPAEQLLHPAVIPSTHLLHPVHSRLN
jgi:hypothetical protein